MVQRKLDKQWIHNISKEYYFIKIFSPSGDRIKKVNYLPYYEYYAQNVSKNDVILKVDDDIIWINISEFKCFVKFIFKSSDTFLVSANIVNNGVIAHLQQKLGVIPSSVGYFEYPKGGKDGSLKSSPTKTYKIHQYFVTHKSEFYREEVIQFKERLSINFFGFIGKHAKKMSEMVEKNQPSDEHAITTLANKWATEVIYMRFVVAHVTYWYQNLKDKKLGSKILKLYS